MYIEDKIQYFLSLNPFLYIYGKNINAGGIKCSGIEEMGRIMMAGLWRRAGFRWRGRGFFFGGFFFWRGYGIPPSNQTTSELTIIDYSQRTPSKNFTEHSSGYHSNIINYHYLKVKVQWKYTIYRFENYIKWRRAIKLLNQTYWGPFETSWNYGKVNFLRSLLLFGNMSNRFFYFGNPKSSTSEKPTSYLEIILFL